MRYDDASQTGPTGHETTGHETVARPDVDTLPAGSYGPATGNAITGAGTSTGSSGADSVGAAPATIVAVQGAGGEAGVANGNFQANGQFGVLSMDAQGNFSYVRNPGTPDGVKDVFNYTLADAHGANASTTLTIDIGQVAAAAAGQGVVALPAGVELSDIHVNGRDLVINMPDGTQMVIPGGAVFVPEITIGDVQVPQTNLAALLINSEPQPAAGQTQSSGGNFATDVPPLDPGVPLGDLIPPTELGYTPPTFQEVFPGLNTIPTVIIETPDNPAGAVNAEESVFEKGLPTRNGGEPAGSGEIADGNGSNNSDTSETNTGTIVFEAKDGLQSITVDGVAITAVGQQIQGQYGTMTITGIDLGSGQITYSYTLADNTSGDNTQDVFAVVVTDSNGDTATASLTVHIVDDVPTARNDTDSTDLVNHVATGNVITGADTTSGAAGADTVGADNASLTAISSNGTGQSDASFDANGNLVVDGQYGTLTIKADGSYVYTAHADAPGGSTEVFTYTLTDGDGDTSQATLTITNPDHFPTAGDNPLVQLDDDALPGGNPGGIGDTPDEVNTTGTLSGSGGDGALTFALSTSGAPAGFTYQLQANGELWVLQGSTHVLTVTVNSATGAYDVTQVAPIMHPPGGNENNVDFTISYTVTDADGDTASSTLQIQVNDDTPVARNDTDSLDSNDTATGNVVTGVGTTSGSAGADSYGADGPGGLIGVSSNSTNQSDTTFDQNGNLVVHGEFGTLTIKADGSYVYTLDQGSHGGGNDVFTYTIIDADGDPTTATLTINVPVQNEPPTAQNSTADVSEEGLPGGNPDTNGNPDNTNSATDSGTIVASDPDGDPLTMTLSAQITGNYTSGGVPVAWTLAQNGHELIGYLAGTDPNVVANQVITVTIQDNGSYVVNLLQPFDDPAHNVEDSISFNVPVTVSDGHGGTASATIAVTVEDDSPTVSASLNVDASVTVDETGPVPASASVNLGGYTAGDDPDVSGAGPIASSSTGSLGIVNPGVSYGADGPGSTSYSLVVENSVSGLTTTDGHAINLVLTSSGTIVGIVQGGAFDGEVAFAIGINGATGQVTVDQYLSLNNPDATNPNDPVHLGANTVGVVVTAVDADGDHVSSPAVDVSGQFTFLDDGPQITSVHASTATVTVDESGPVPASATVALGTGNTGGDDPDVSGTGPIASASSGSSVVSATIDYGADGPGSPPSYSLVVENATSGLETTDGHAINLVLTDAGTIVGIVQGGAFDGEVAFAIGINSSTGEVTVDQYLSLHNPDATDPNDPVHLDNGTIGVVVSATDGDGDPVSNAANPADISGNFTFLDDGPQITSAHSSSATVTVDESGPVPASATVSLGSYTGGNDPDVAGTGPIASGNSGTSSMITATIDYGADGQGTAPTYSLVVENAVSGLETTDGHAINLVLTGDGTIVGIVSGGSFNGEVAFAIGIDSSTGAVTVDQYLSLHNPDATNPNDPVYLNNGTVGVVVSATDGDGDPVSNIGHPVDISGQFTFLDDGPSVTPGLNENATVTVDESGPVPASATVALGGHTAGNDPDVSGAGPIAEGDTGSTSVVDANALFGADGPSITGVQYSLVVDNAVSGLETTDGHAINLVLTSAGTIVGIVSGGTFDGDVAFAIGINSSTGVVTVDQYLSLHNPDATDPNDPVYLNNGTVGVVVTATDGDGDPVSNSGNPVDISGQFTFLDDGPHITSAHATSATVTVDESGPVPASATVALGTGHTGGNDPDVAGAGPIATGNSGGASMITASIDYGADGQGTAPTYSLAVENAVSGLTTTDGHAINLVLTDAGTIVGIVSGGTFDGQVAFAVGINSSTGAVTIDQYLSLHNPDATDPNDPVHLNNGTIGVVVSATDGDGDPVSNSASPVDISGQFTFLDDGPTAATNGNGVGTVTLDETRPVGSDTSGAGSPSGLATATINLAAGFVTGSGVNYGADGPGSVSYALHLSSSSVGSGLYALDPTDTSTSDGDGYGQGQQIMLTQSGNTITGAVGSTIYFTITINPSTGVATFTQVNNIWNPNAGSSAAALDDTATLTTALASALQVQQIVTDGDGDTSTASINIGQGVFQIQDDGPTAIHPDSIVTTDEAQAKIFAYLDADHSVIENFGTDGPGTITFANITNGMDSGLTSGGTAITYWLSADGQTLDARINSTNGSDGTLIFEVHIDQATSQYDYTQFGMVDNGSGVSFNDLTSTKAGNVDLYGIGANAVPAQGPNVDALLSGTHNGANSTINTDATSIGVGNQSMNPGDALRIDFVQALVTDSGNATTGFDYTQHVDTNLFQQKIPQVVGQPTTVSFQVWALESADTQSNYPDSNPSGGFTDSTKEPIVTVGIEGSNALTQPMVTATLTTVGQVVTIAYGVTATLQADGSVIFANVPVNFTYEIGTGANSFNAVDVQDVSGKFDLGIFSLGTTNLGNPVNLSYDLQIKDADGDTVALPGAINIELDPAGSQNAAVVNAASTLAPTSTTTSGTSHTGSLVGSNDNHEHLHLDRPFAVGQNAALMAALAAVGLETEHSRFGVDMGANAQGHAPVVAPFESATIAPASFEPTHIVASARIAEPAVKPDATHLSHSGAHNHDASTTDHVAGHSGKEGAAMSELLHAAAHSGHAPAANSSPVTASAVVMPSAQQLAAAAAAAHGGGQAQTSLAGQEPQHNEVVSKVLADSLQGGEGHGPSIDQLVNSLPGSHSAGAVIEALASHQGMAVSFGHIAFSMGFSGSHMVPMEEAMHAAAPPAHG